MPSPLRIQYIRAVYHVMARGTQGQPVYQNDADRLRFLETLAEACATTGWRGYASVRMPNQDHLLWSTPEGDLIEGRKGLPGTYTQRLRVDTKCLGTFSRAGLRR